MCNNIWLFHSQQLGNDCNVALLLRGMLWYEERLGVIFYSFRLHSWACRLVISFIFHPFTIALNLYLLSFYQNIVLFIAQPSSHFDFTTTMFKISSGLCFSILQSLRFVRIPM